MSDYLMMAVDHINFISLGNILKGSILLCNTLPSGSGYDHLLTPEASLKCRFVPNPCTCWIPPHVKIDCHTFYLSLGVDKYLSFRNAK